MAPLGQKLFYGQSPPAMMPPQEKGDEHYKPDHEWVQCCGCCKWRMLTAGFNSKSLPDEWRQGETKEFFTSYDEVHQRGARRRLLSKVDSLFLLSRGNVLYHGSLDGTLLSHGLTVPAQLSSPSR